MRVSAGHYIAEKDVRAAPPTAAALHPCPRHFLCFFLRCADGRASLVLGSGSSSTGRATWTRCCKRSTSSRTRFRRTRSMRCGEFSDPLMVKLVEQPFQSHHAEPAGSHRRMREPTRELHQPLKFSHNSNEAERILHNVEGNAMLETHGQYDRTMQVRASSRVARLPSATVPIAA